MKLSILALAIFFTACVHQPDIPRLYSSVEQTVARVGTASGVIVAPGYMLTSAHLVVTAHKNAIVEIDTANDLALVRADTNGGIIARLSKSTAQIGAPVLVIGYPMGLAKQAIVGIIGAINQDFVDRKGVYFVDASVNRGHSGAPMFNAEGEVIAITSAYVRGTPLGESVQKIGIAIPIDRAFPMLKRAGLW